MAAISSQSPDSSPDDSGDEFAQANALVETIYRVSYNGRESPQSTSRGRTMTPGSVTSNTSSRKSRSRSPMIKPIGNARSLRMPSPHIQFRLRTSQTNFTHCILPLSFSVSFRPPWGHHIRRISGDVRKTGENIILWTSLLVGLLQTRTASSLSDFWVEIGTHSVAYQYCVLLLNFLYRACLPPQCYNNLSALDAFIIFLPSESLKSPSITSPEPKESSLRISESNILQSCLCSQGRFWVHLDDGAQKLPVGCPHLKLFAPNTRSSRSVSAIAQTTVLSPVFCWDQLLRQPVYELLFAMLVNSQVTAFRYRRHG